jgi:hypothetical protein
VVHNISTTGYIGWYLGSSLLASTITCLPGIVVGAWGYDPLLKICWLSSRDSHKRVVWSLGTTYVWTILSAAIAFVSTFSVLIKLFLTGRKTRDAFSAAGLHSHPFAKHSVLQSVTLRILPHPLFLSRCPIRKCRLVLH